MFDRSLHQARKAVKASIYCQFFTTFHPVAFHTKLPFLTVSRGTVCLSNESGNFSRRFLASTGQILNSFCYILYIKRCKNGGIEEHIQAA
jgi:hypothetical protein